MGLLLQGAGSPGTPPFVPSDIPDLQAWYAADSLGLANNAPVASWTDLTGNSRPAVQVTGSKQPLYKTAQFGSLPGVAYDGVDDESAASFVAANVGTIIAVAKYAAAFASGTDTVFDSFSSFGPALYRGNGTQVRAYAGGAEAVVSTSQTTAHVYSARMGLVAAGGQLNIDAGAPTAFTRPALSLLGGIRLGKGNSNSGVGFGDIVLGEVLFYGRAISDVEWAAAQTYLKAKWGTP